VHSATRTCHAIPRGPARSPLPALYYGQRAVIQAGQATRNSRKQKPSVPGRQLQPFGMANPGLVWLPEADARGLATPAEPLSYLVNLRLAPGAEADAFAVSCNDDDVSSPMPLISDWQCLQATDNGQVMTEQEALLTASWLLALLAVGSVTVLVGSRMAEQTRRAGLLKAVGGTPRLVASILLAARRPRRALLGAASVFVAVSGVAAALWAQASLDRYDSGPGPPARWTRCCS
jgi:putative ABC transport system permease protein